SVEYFIAMLDDTTARHTAEEAAAANLMQLERLNQLKSDFLRTTRHEFRSALVGIQGFSELIRDVEHLDPTEVKEFAADIYDGARKLDEMIEEMLSLDRAGGRHAAVPEPDRRQRGDHVDRRENSGGARTARPVPRPEPRSANRARRSCQDEGGRRDARPQCDQVLAGRWTGGHLEPGPAGRDRRDGEGPGRRAAGGLRQRPLPAG